MKREHCEAVDRVAVVAAVGDVDRVVDARLRSIDRRATIRCDRVPLASLDSISMYMIALLRKRSKQQTNIISTKIKPARCNSSTIGLLTTISSTNVFKFFAILTLQINSNP